MNELAMIYCRCMAPPTPLDTTLRSEREAQLEEALAGLPAIYREAVILVAIEGFTHEQAAQVSGIRADAVRKRFSRGIRLIKSMVARAGEPPEGEQHE